MERGQKFNIAPSDGFLGIAKGEVQIIRIAKYEDVYEEYADPEVIADLDPDTKHSNWIVYKYTKPDPNNKDTYSNYCLDEDTFEYHTSGRFGDY